MHIWPMCLRYTPFLTPSPFMSQWIVGGVIGPRGAPAAVPVMLAPDDATDRGPTQPPRSEVGNVRGPVWPLSFAVYSPVKVGQA